MRKLKVLLLVIGMMIMTTSCAAVAAGAVACALDPWCY